MRTVKTQWWILVFLLLLPFIYIVQGCEDIEPEPEFKPNADLEYTGDALKFISLHEQIAPHVDGVNLDIVDGIVQVQNIDFFEQDVQASITEILSMETQFGFRVPLPPPPPPCPIGGDKTCLLQLSQIRYLVLKGDESVSICPEGSSQECILEGSPGEINALYSDFEGHRYTEFTIFDETFEGNAIVSYKDIQGQVFSFCSNITK